MTLHGTRRFATVRISLLLVCVAVLAATTPTAFAATILVRQATSVFNNGDGCSLSEAIENANDNAATHPDCAAGDPGQDVITFQPATVTSTDVMFIVEDLLIQGPVTIDGSSASRIFTIASGATATFDLTTIQNGIDSAILISSGNLIATLCNFNNNVSATSGGGAINGSGTGNDIDIAGCTFDSNSSPTGDGGAIQKGSNGTMNISASFFVDNTAGGTGGAIDTNGPGTIFATAFQDNEAAGATSSDGGGAIYFDPAAVFTITASAFSGNLATGTDARGGAIFASATSSSALLSINYSHFGSTPIPLPFPLDALTDPNEAQGAGSIGGAIYTRSPTEILGSSFIGNLSGGDGGAVGSNTRNTFDSFIANSTFSGNVATGAGGAIYQFAESVTRDIDLINVTIADNGAAAGSGGGIFVDEFTGGNASIGVSNSIIASNTGGNCAVAAGTVINDDSDNLVFGTACPGITPLTTGDPVIDGAELAFSLTIPAFLTYAAVLGQGSAASGSGNPTTCSNFPILDLDQRGFPRPAGETDCDIGAYESELVPEPSAQLGIAAALLSLLTLHSRRRRRGA